MAKPAQPLDPATRNAAEAWAVEYFAQNYDPYWRAVLIEGLLTLMRDRPRLTAAALAASGVAFVADDQYVHGTAARGLVAAGVNELAMHCEDLFALIRAVHGQASFAHGIASYKPGNATGLAGPLVDRDDAWVRKALLVPDAETLTEGLAAAEDSHANVKAEEATARIVAWCREAARWYGRHEVSHLRYKHGLRLLLGGFGPLSEAAIEERRDSTSAALISLTNRPLKDGQGVLMFQVPDRLRGFLVALMERRLLLRVEMVPSEVDLAEVAALAWKVAAVQACILANRLALNAPLGPEGEYAVQLPHSEASMRQTVWLRLIRAPTLDDYTIGK